MKQAVTIFLQAVIVALGIVVLAILIRFPLTEGRAKNSDLFSIYTDPFILYGYASSIAFFLALYKAFRLFGYIRHHNTITLRTVKALRSIKYSSILLSILILLAGLYIRLFHNKDDDPAGFLAICIVTIAASISIAAVASAFENKLQKKMYTKPEK